MSDRAINVKVGGQVDTAKLEASLQRAEERARRLKQELEGARGGINRLGQAGDQIEKILKGGLGNLVNLAAGGLAGGAMYSRVSGGLNAYKQHLVQLDEEARSVKRLGEAYRDYHKAVVDAGRAYGYSNQEVIGLQSMLGRTRGRAGANQLLPDMRTVQGFGRGYGMSAMEAGGHFNRSIEMGMIGRGGDMSDMRQFATLISDAVVQGGMQGREGEVIGSIQRLTGAISSKMVTVGGTATAGEALATMNATGIRGLQGEQGAALLERLNAAVMQPGGGQAGDLFMYRALSGGQQGMQLGDYRYLQEEGLGGVGPSGKSNLQSLMEASQQTGLSGKYQLMAMQQLTGLSMHQVEALQRTFMPQGKFETAKFGATQQALGPGGLSSVDASVLPLISELANGGDIGAVGKEFEQLAPGQKAEGTREGLLNQIKQFGQQNVAMSQGQRQEQLDNDLAKAAEDAGAGLLELKNAADQLATKFLELGGAIGGPLGGIAPIALGSLGGSALSAGGQYGLKKLFGMGSSVLGGAAPATTAAAAEAAGGGGMLGPAAAGGGGMLAGGMALGGGLLAGSAAAYAGSAIGQSVYGTQAFLGEGHRSAIGQGWSSLMGQLGSGDLGGAASNYMNAAGAMAMAAPGVIGGTLWGAGKSLITGGNFQEAYREGFFGINRFDSQGRQQWQAEQNGGGGQAGGWGGQGAQQGGGLGQLGGDDQKQAEKVDGILKGTGMEGRGSLMIALAKKYNVPIELALAQAQKEDQFNTTGSSPDNNNPFNLRYTGNWGDDRPGRGGFAHFPSTDAGIEGYFMLMGNVYGKQIAEGVQTGDWSSLVNKYAPPSENDSKLYSQQMAAWTQMYHQKLMPSSRGGWFDVGADDTPAMLHKREMVLPASLAEELRQAIRQPGITAAEAKMAGGELRVRIDPIVIQLPGGITTTVNAEGRHTPFQGVIDHPTGNN